MDHLSQEEDFQFFDANEEASPSCFDFDPGSVVERRKKFLEWMGLEQVLVQQNNSDVGSGLDGDSVEATEKRSGGCSFSSTQVSSSGSSEELSLRVDKNVGGCDVTRRQSSSLAPCSDPTCCQVKETEKQRSITSRLTSSKKRWLTRLLSMGCSADTKIQSGVLSRVKVKHYKKQTKELSSLYQSQDIKAHNGSISAMKFSCDGKYLASSGEDGIVRVWKVIEEKRSKLPRDYLNPSCMYFELNDLSQLKPNKTTEKFKKTSDSACVVFPPKAFRIMEKPLHEFRGHTCEVLDISWSKDNFNPANEEYFMSGSVDGKVRIWNIPGCNVVDWADVKDIISAVCYRPDGQGGVVGSLTGSCRFFNMSGEYLELDSQIHFHNKKISPNKRITCFQFLPQDPSKVLVVSADSKVRILQGNDVVRRYKGSPKSDGKYIVSACEDSNVYIWSNGDASDSSSSSQTKRIRSFERFSSNASVAATWRGFSDQNKTISVFSPPCLSLKEGFVTGSVPKGNATWPEENLPANPLSSSAMTASQYKFLKSSYQRATSSSLAWGMVIVTGGWDGRIRTFQNYGLPVTVT
ncbi:hypothetical protein F2Q70_00008056 [Brassica cretica]|uniref:WD repeat-containing protein 44 n=1 Tax=Brassica cretica TaxID=69181 RepID=A0A8S9JDA4_BRACR|nr:hypothetical protein F2Q68_00001088 [Brassica cretica]KAF2610710.1 hypothetical protein F2Q70_00008056 [Brassica cretica]